MDLLKRSFAPITQQAWEAIDGRATEVLKADLTARRFVDVSEPKGWTFAALGLGRLDVPPAHSAGDVVYGIHRVQPLIEFRVPFELEIWELDNIARGARDVDLGPVVQAAQTAARFEDSAVLKGFSAANIEGLEQRVEHPPVAFRFDAHAALDAIGQAVLTLHAASVEGPYSLFLGARAYRFLASCPTEYPLVRQIENLLGGPVVDTDIIEDGFLVSRRGGDFELVLGQDFSLGYETHSSRTVRLFVTESFTFRVLRPAAMVKLQVTAGDRGSAPPPSSRGRRTRRA